MNIFKYKKELKEFREYKKHFIFQQLEINVDDNGNKFCENMPLQSDDGKTISACEKWINVGYKLHEPLSKALSNLFPYTFWFKGKKLHSIESFFQGIKIKDKKTQNLSFKYFGIDSNSLKGMSDINWKQEQTLYWQGKPYERDSVEYSELIDELYISAVQNKLYRNALINVKLPIIHSIGVEDKKETVFTRYEFEFMLNCLSSFLKSKSGR